MSAEALATYTAATRLKWDRRFLRLADFWGKECSKDPSTKVGAVLVRGRKVVNLGYNGFPPGIADTEERLNDRPTKYGLMVHGEINAILNAGQSVEGCTLYTTPFQPCRDCTKIILAAGIARVVAPYPTAEQRIRWGTSFDEAAALLAERGVALDLIPEWAS